MQSSPFFNGATLASSERPTYQKRPAQALTVTRPDKKIAREKAAAYTRHDCTGRKTRAQSAVTQNIRPAEEATV
jgi:hypothetical protein